MSDALTKAISRFQELKPEVTALDITMSEKDGISALREIIELGPSIKLGAKDFVVKPFQADRVLEAVGKALA